MGQPIKCYWSTTGYAFETPSGACSCRIAASPGVVLYRGELAALEHERDRIIAEALEDEDKLAELEGSVPPDYEACLASACAKLSSMENGDG